MTSPQSLPPRPKLFLDASSARPQIAHVIAAGLAGIADVTTACAGIADASRTFDLAVFVLGGAQDAGGLLRLGVFLGALGRERVVLVGPALTARDLPSELCDVTLATYAPHGDGDDAEAIKTLCATLEEHVGRLTHPAHTPAPANRDAAPQVARRLRRSLGTARSIRSGQTLRIADISVTGALLETYGEIPEHQLLDLDVTLENGRSVGVIARVVRIQYPQWGKVGGVGVQFTRFSGDSQAILEQYLDPVSS